MLFQGRAAGIAVSFELTPHHAASSNRHFWNSIIDHKGDAVPFNGPYESPFYYHPENIRRIGKVFRKTYSAQPEAVANFLPPQDIPEGFSEMPI